MVGIKKNTSSDQNKKVVRLTKFDELNTLIKDESATTGKTEAAIIENAISDRYLNTKEREMSFSVINCITREDAVTEMCRSVFAYFAAMPGNAKKETMIPLLKQCFGMSFWQTVEISKEVPCIYHFRDQLESVYSFFKECDEKHVVCNGKEFDYTDRLVKDFFKQLLKDVDLVLDGKREKVVWRSGELGSIFTDIIGYFEFAQQPRSKTFGQWSITYRLLHDLAEIAPWENSAENRYNLVKIIKNIQIGNDDFDSFNPNFVSLNKHVWLNGKTILTTKDAIILKSNPSLDEKSFKNAERIIHGPNGRKTKHPMIILFNDESYDELKKVLIECVKSYYEEFPDPNDVYNVPILAFGKYMDQRIQWYQV